jgi:hypothetical protein
MTDRSTPNRRHPAHGTTPAAEGERALAAELAERCAAQSAQAAVWSGDERPAAPVARWEFVIYETFGSERMMAYLWLGANGPEWYTDLDDAQVYKSRAWADKAARKHGGIVMQVSATSTKGGLL